MGAGGIINDRVSSLLAMLMAPWYYDSLTDEEKDAVEVVNAKPKLMTDQGDMDTLKNIFNCVTSR